VATGLTIYSTTWCGHCVRLKRQLQGAGVTFDEIDIDQVPEAEALVRAANDGDATVPTLVFADGRTLTNPPLTEVLEAVAVTA
jgi:mycoredoxin